MLAPTFEAAVRVAKAGLLGTPPLPVPGPLRPVVRMTRLSAAALAAAGKALDDDEDFRERVALFVDDDTIGKAGVLFLTRPDGWEDELQELVRDADADAVAAGEEREERSLARRLKGAEEATRRAERARDVASEAAARATRELADERRARRSADEQAARAAARAAALEQERDALRRRLDAALPTIAELEASVAALRSTSDGSDVARAAAEQRAAEAAAALDAARATVDQIEQRQQSRSDAAARAVADASAAAAELAGALARVAKALGFGEAVDASPPRDAPTTAEPLIPVDSPRGAGRAPAAGVERRQPAPLPFAVFDDAPEAADHLLRMNGVVLLVDGYNVSMAAWPELAIAEQRRRLVDALGELAVRTGADVHVVFDGADEGGVQRADPGARRLVRVSFTPGDVEADDVLLDLVDALPVRRPVVVASDDRRVREGATSRGANVLRGGQLLAAMRRDR